MNRYEEMQNFFDEALLITRKMLSLGKLRLSTVYPNVRLKHIELYRIAIKTSNYISKERFIEDMRVLLEDIQTTSDNEKRKQLQDILKHFLKRNRFQGDISNELFDENYPKQNMQQ